MSQQPPPPPPPSGPPAKNRALPWIVGGVVVVVLAVVVVLVLTLTGGKAAEDATSVQDVADLAVDAAQDLDVEAGIDLLCEAPSDARRDILDRVISDGQEEAGSDDPDVSYEVSDVSGGGEGTFGVHVSSDDEGLEGNELDFEVTVETQGGRACITDIVPR